MNDIPGSPQDHAVGEVSQIEPFDEELVARLVFRVGGQPVAHEPERVGELVRDPAIHRVPNAPAVLAGLLNSRGRVVPVYDIRPLLPARGDERPVARGIEWVLVFHEHEQGDDRSADDCVGLVIDEMPLRLRLTPLHHRPTEELPELFRPWCRQFHERERSLYGELDMIGLIEALATGDVTRGNSAAGRSASGGHAESAEHEMASAAVATPIATARDAGSPKAPNGDGRYDQ